VLLAIAGVCLLFFVLFVVVSAIVVVAGDSLEVCAAHHGARADVEWHWFPPHPECVWRSGGTEHREAVVFDPVTGSVALLLFAGALGTFGWWLVLMVREADRIAEERLPKP
jgi:hypothetical protein